MSNDRRIILYRGAVYAQACGLADGCNTLSPDDVSAILADQYFNRGKTTPEGLKDKWVQSSEFVLTHVYPSAPNLGVAPGKTGETFSMGKPLIVDLDFHGIAEWRNGRQPRFLVLDGQNRVVRLRRQYPRQKYPAYVGDKILKDVEAETSEMESRVQEANDVLRRHSSSPSGTTRMKLQHLLSAGLVTPEEVPWIQKRAAEVVRYLGAEYGLVDSPSASVVRRTLG